MKIQDDDFKQSINYKKVVQRFFNFKRLYIASIILFLALAFIYNRTATVLFENSTMVLITEENKNPLAAGQDFGLGMAFLSGQNNIDNEIEILKSFSLIKEAVQEMDLRASIYSYEKSFYSDFLENTNFVKKSEEYKESSSPIDIMVDPVDTQATYLPFFIEFINDNEFYIRTKPQKDPIYLYDYIDDKVVGQIAYKPINEIRKFGQPIKTAYGTFIINRTLHFDKDFTKDRVLYFYFNNYNLLTFEYQAYLNVEQTSQTSSILKLTLRGTNYYRITDFLNYLTQVFKKRNMEKKNTAAASTVSFIDAQISQFKDSLERTEALLKAFRESNQVMDMNYQGQMAISQILKLETERAALEEERRYWENLKQYLEGGSVLPEIKEPLFRQYTEAQTRLNNLGEQNIQRQQLERELGNLRVQIERMITNQISNYNTSISKLNGRISQLENEVRTMPQTELQLQGIERKFELNSEINTFLLKKRAEAQITKAASMPDYEVVEPALAINPVPVSPRKSLNYLLAFFLALLLPTIYILIIDFFNNKLGDIEEIERMAGKPVLGKIFRSFRKTTLIVAQRPKSSVSESFRTVRTNFQFFDHSGKKQVVLLTSSASGDGKTFCSINFASVLALNGHRTALLEFDLRRPKIHQEFGASNMIGISSFLIDKAVIDDIILPTEVENLDLISAGPAAPNPAELISSERTSEFLETLKEMYDYIVIDSAPVGIVSETFLLMKHSDVNIFVVRLDYTVRDAYRNALKGLANNGFSNYNLLINDLNIRKESYKYGYDTKYYTDDRRGFFRRLFRKKKNEEE